METPWKSCHCLHEGEYTSLLHPWDFPGKSTGVGCHCLLHLQMTGRIKKHTFKLCDVPKLHQPVTCFGPESWTSFL